MRKLLTFLKSKTPAVEGRGHAGGWLEARELPRCQSKDPLNASAMAGFVQARFMSMLRVLYTMLAFGGAIVPASARCVMKR